MATWSLTQVGTTVQIGRRPVTRFIYLSYKGTPQDFIAQLNSYLNSGYTTLIGNLAMAPGMPTLREVLLENHDITQGTGVSLVTNY